ncbi:HD domain-containing protein [Paenibacillus sp. N1-5-1-14]|uniref:CCA tRNA nucleotidyltransferase n=1 Tax=Paenibacillus radicibacter TaxID=2972488 RepID=UPI002158F841|nr:HD domain-containing protein [Paenibacillus radicibacter]MCR8641369.1 HD domain-containing protein [Paenibacillus radicibacter]
MVTIKIPTKVENLLSHLNSGQFEAYVVGGCVRDSILGREPNDWDICTNATPEEVIATFTDEIFKVIPTGLKHGTLTVVYGDEHFEITTYRIDGEYSDGRRPDKIKFTNSIMEDLSRRDFTINAIAYNPLTGIVDPFDGMKHISLKRIKAVGDPYERYNEDALRMMRAIRFSSQLDFEIDGSTLFKIKDNAHLIMKVSQERIRDELCKILISNNPEVGMSLLALTELLKYILPELDDCIGFKQHNPNHNMCVFDHTLAVIENTPINLKTRLAAMFHDIAKPRTFSIDENGIGHFYNHHMVGMYMTKEILSRLKFDNQMISDVSVLVKEHMSRHKNTSNTVAKKFINRVGKDNINDLFDLMIADTLGSKKPHDYSDVCQLKEMCERSLNEKEPMNLKDLAINGDDLILIGFKPNRQMGQTLNNLMEEVLKNPLINKRDLLLEMARGMIE